MKMMQPIITAMERYMAIMAIKNNDEYIPVALLEKSRYTLDASLDAATRYMSEWQVRKYAAIRDWTTGEIYDPPIDIRLDSMVIRGIPLIVVLVKFKDGWTSTKCMPTMSKTPTHTDNDVITRYDMVLEISTVKETHVPKMDLVDYQLECDYEWREQKSPDGDRSITLAVLPLLRDADIRVGYNISSIIAELSNMCSYTVGPTKINDYSLNISYIGGYPVMVVIGYYSGPKPPRMMAIFKEISGEATSIKTM